MRHRYDISTIAKGLGITKRTLQRKLKQLGVNKDENGYLITDKTLELLGATEVRQETDTGATYEPGLHKQEDGTVMQVFTQEEYETFKRMLVEHKQLKNQVNQLEQWKETFLHYAQSRNVLSAHDKGLITPPNQEDSEDIEQKAIVKHLHEKRKEVLRKGTLSTWMTQFKGEA